MFRNPNKAARHALAVLALLLALASEAQAQTTITAAPASRTLALGATPSFTVQWVAVGGAGAANSLSGELIDRATGALVQAIPTPLVLTVPGRVSETVRLDRNRLAALARSAVSGLEYRRVWIDPAGGRNVISQRITLGGSQAGPLSVRAVRVLFADGNNAPAVVDVGDRPAAYGEVSFSGRGATLEYEWRLADPASTRAEPVFVRIAQARISVRGASPLRIAAPPLPTLRVGRHLLQLRLRDPAATADGNRRIDVISTPLVYVVRPSRRAPAAIQPLGPSAGIVLGGGTRFAWSAVPGAAGYRLELFDDATPPRRLTGVQMKADIGTEAGLVLGPLAREGLAGGCRCQWRVLAFDGDGETIGESPSRPLIVPAEDAPLAP